jgi:hypothetical protein
MTEENLQAETLDNDAPIESSPIDESKAIDPGTTDTQADTPAEPTPEEIEKKKGAGVQKRINEITKEKYQYKNERDELLKRVESLELKTQPTEPVKPKFDQFDSDADYEAAVDRFYTDKAAHEAAVRTQQETVKAREAKRNAERVRNNQAFLMRIEAEKANFENFDAVTRDEAFNTVINQFSPDIIALIQASDKSTALTYEFATNLEQAELLASMPPIQAAHELSKIESRLDKLKPKTISNAPDPIKPAGGSAPLKDEWSDIGSGASYE